MPNIGKTTFTGTDDGERLEAMLEQARQEGAAAERQRIETGLPTEAELREIMAATGDNPRLGHRVTREANGFPRYAKAVHAALLRVVRNDA